MLPVWISVEKTACSVYICWCFTFFFFLILTVPTLEIGLWYVGPGGIYLFDVC